MEKPVTRFKANVVACLSYLLGWASALAVLAVERKNRFVRLHAIQSLVVSGILTMVFLSLDYIGEAGLTIGAFLLLAMPVFLIVSMVGAYRGRGVWISRTTPHDIPAPVRRRNPFLFLTVACFLGFVALLVSRGLLGVRDTMYITTEGYVTPTTISQREDFVWPDFWFRGQDTWQTQVFPNKKVSFRYELDNHRFSQYSGNVEVTLWTASTAGADPRHPLMQQKVLDLLSKPIEVPPFSKLQIEWILDTAGLDLGAVPEQQYQPYPTSYMVLIKRGETERKVFLLFLPLR